MTDRSLKTCNFLGIILLMILGGVFSLSSCATIIRKPLIFKSEDYIVYKLRGRETPAKLAKKFLGDDKKAWVVEEANEGVSFKGGQIVTIPLKEENKAGLRVDGFQVVPILVYHQFAKSCDSPLCMPTQIFEQQMNYLKKNGFRVVSCNELLGFLRYRHPLPKKAVVITIDDGYRSAYDIAYPILNKYGFRATLFVYTDFVGASSNAVTWDQLKEMKEDGFEIGGHTVSHIDLTQQREGEDQRAYEVKTDRELRVSKQIIDERLGQDTVLLAFPYGRYNPSVLHMCSRLGYKMGLSVQRGSNPFFADPLRLKRNQIMRKDMKSFFSRLETYQKVSLK
jgi:peptidoglycan/xylan/chitin deacetylase (PgdA/CDA1 family)